MDSEENHLSQSIEFQHLHRHQHLEENSNISKNFIPDKHSSHVMDSRATVRSLVRRIEVLEKKLDVLESRGRENEKKNKKIRRKAKEIARIFKCTLGNCGKEYGSEASLKNHRKIKHGIRLFRTKKRPENIRPTQN